MKKESQEMFDKLRATTVGLDSQYRLADGRTTRRIYLDSTASTLQLDIAKNVLNKYLPHYANTHSNAHFNARISNREYRWAHDMVLDFVNANPKTHGCFFVGSGTTGGINRVARTLANKYPSRDTVITSVMEHHSNDLPHRKNFKNVIHAPLTMNENGFGAVNVAEIEKLLAKHKGRVNYIALTAASNVTGIINPIYEIARLAHKYDTLIVVDAAQMAAHSPITVSTKPGAGSDNCELDIVCFSGHKIYTPTSPGVVVARYDLFEVPQPDEVGGGMVENVYIDRFSVIDNFIEREEAGTPNIAGAIALGSVLYALKKIGMDNVADKENELVDYAIEKLTATAGVIIYGDTDIKKCPRIGAISFNLRGVHHAHVAAVLNDYFNIAVRNACFCAHPYVRELISIDLGTQDAELSNSELEALAELHRGMVRMSFGVYNQRDEVDALVAALSEIYKRRDYFAEHYVQVDKETFAHKNFKFNSSETFSARTVVDDWFADTES